MSSIYFTLDSYLFLHLNNENPPENAKLEIFSFILKKHQVINCTKANYYLWINNLHAHLNEKRIKLIGM